MARVRLAEEGGRWAGASPPPGTRAGCGSAATEVRCGVLEGLDAVFGLMMCAGRGAHAMASIMGARGEGGGIGSEGTKMSGQ